jgi:hypothetical protein
MNQARCQGTNKQGEPCRARPIKGRPWCLKHDPLLANERRAWERAGGKGKSNTARAAKRLPADLQDTLKTLYRALAALEAGEMEPARASAMANVCRAIVTVFEMGDAERRIADIEAMLREQTA